MDVDDVRARAARLLERHAERLKSRAMEDDDSDSQDEQEKGNVNVTSHRSDDMQREKANEENEEEEEEEEEDESMDPPAAPETARAAAVELPAGTQSTDGIAPSSSSLASRSVPTPGRGRQGRQDAENVETYLLQRGRESQAQLRRAALEAKREEASEYTFAPTISKRRKICFERACCRSFTARASEAARGASNIPRRTAEGGRERSTNIHSSHKRRIWRRTCRRRCIAHDGMGREAVCATR